MTSPNDAPAPPHHAPAGGPLSRPGEPSWIVRVESRDGGGAWEYVVTERQLQRVRGALGVAVALIVGLALGLLLTLPRSMAYGGLLHENLALKSRLQGIDRQMAEIDRILLRLRLYDAQLDSMAVPTGDHGPVDLFANADIGDGEIPLDLAPFEDEGPGEEATGGLRPAVSWAEGIEARADTFLSLFARAEPNLSQLMEELEGLRALESVLPSLWPAHGTLTSGYGWRKSPFGSSWRFHSGIDIAGSRGIPIYAAAPGKVLRAEYNQGYGRMVELDHGYGVTTLYAHCHALRVAVDAFVDRGDIIAALGSTGRSTGPHVHFEVRLDGHAVDPLDYLPR